MSVPLLRFAPSPNGRLHFGHAYSALLNDDVARRLGGRCLLRIEDIDPGRSRPELIGAIEEDLAWLGLTYERPMRRQSEHMGVYRRALDQLIERRLVYPCFCSRGTIRARVAQMQAAGTRIIVDPDGTPIYPGTCRTMSDEQSAQLRSRGAPHTWRLDMARALDVAPYPFGFRCFEPDGSGADVPADPSRWGDAVIARRDVPTSYHLSVVLDDDAQGISHIVRGADLLAATDLHVLLQRLLGLRSPAYHHHRLIMAEDGEKLAKSRGSETLGDLRARGVTSAEIRAKLGF
ncbi:Glutamate--tRNA ligase [Methylobacterium gnaphalii]|uniref:tRNA glutamyl-Q(34) synthetase GluQRS n=1 Tax=Methylobacterium gnaphalii TaxID=1010610 RepID=A0A512JJC5_9HYPH|nr:tRNA glutamyl-Q(34) synthetase GluQRS [Methylobacterium gnaphalii]GEP10034.1 tRNA glutamyl-Q(34) synthetase GluQRS [Methylobacterium gnaphalii]GJD67701.1 Glutamate--tRNA ligase [Methylobacterium gnaphalii]GLS48304.1 tRNA glutamyl-Q(34) synthetase GluQRS [Methylobacterium gnaphalii]